MTARERRRQRRRRTRSSRPLVLGLLGIGGLVGTIVLALGAYVLSVAASTPAITKLTPIDEGTSSVIYAADGSRLGYIQSDTARQPVRLSQIPEQLQQATIAIEDRNFYRHGGIDISGIARAAVADVEAGRAVQGGSTITQQLVRNRYIVDPKRDLTRKIKEAKFADDLESIHSKDWILEAYLNTASYGTLDGRTAVGVEAGARTFFSKSVSKIGLAEAALLAGLPQAPTDYNPFLNPTAALERRNEVLEAMYRERYISRAEADEAERSPLKLRRGTRYTRIREPYFFDFVQQQLIKHYGVATVRKGGLKVYTTIDPELQEAARASIDGILNLPDDPAAAVVSVDPKTGYVRAMASSGTYQHKQYNLAAQGHRQPGSAFKTFVLVTALKNGVNPYSTSYTSKPLDLNLAEYGPWKVQTYGNTYGGSMNLVTATLRSDNTVYAQLDLDLGPDQVRQTAYDMGIETELDALPAEGLGGLRLGVSPLEMASAYATLAAGGVHSEPIAIERVQFPDRHVEEPGKPQRRRVLQDGIAFEATKILHQNVTGGTGTRANTGCASEAGKTGTTDNFNDAWFVGYTPTMSTSVWVGYPDALREMTSVHGISVAGGTFPAQIWHDYMTVALNGECEPVQTPKHPAVYKAFQGRYSQQFGSAAPYSPYGTTPSGVSAGGGDYRGYDPRAYGPGQDQPQQDQQSDEPDVEVEGGKHDHGNGNGTGGH
jgi:penicillin-binding protein 1A